MHDIFLVLILIYLLGIVCVSHFVKASSLWQLQFITFLEWVKSCDHLLIFEGVLFQRKLKLLIIDAALLGL